MGISKGHHEPVRRLGQNFLVQPRLAEEIVASIAPGASDVVLEPGPGHGTLTTILVRKAGKVIAIEKDPSLVAELRSTFADRSNLTIIEGDVLKMKDSLPSFNKMVSTPPYYISSKLALLLTARTFEVAAIVFQKEFGERLLAEPGTRDYGRLTVMVDRKLVVEKLLDISRNAFYPRPTVDSALLLFKPKTRVSEIDEILFEEMVRGLFNQRRRLVKSSLLHFLSLKFGREAARGLIAKVRVPDGRVYELTIDQLERLSLQLWGLISQSLGDRSSTE